MNRHKEKEPRFQQKLTDKLMKLVDRQYAFSFGYTMRDVRDAATPKNLRVVYPDWQRMLRSKKLVMIMAGGDVHVTKCQDDESSFIVEWPGKSAERTYGKRVFTMMLLEMMDTGYTITRQMKRIG